MNRKGVNLLLIEVVSFIVFGLTILIWFTGLETLVGNLDDSLAVRNFNKFLEPISQVCGGKDESVALGLDLNVFGSTFLVTQLTVPDYFRTSPQDFGMLPLPMKKCVGTNCLCLMEFKEFEGDWQMCTTSEWDIWSMSMGIAPGCPFWYYAPPDMIEQMVSNMFALLDFKGELALSAMGRLLDDVAGGYDRNYFKYPAPESWGGCEQATADNLVISTFLENRGEFKCSKIKNKDLRSCFFDIDGSIPTPRTEVQDNYVTNDEVVSEWFDESLSNQLEANMDNLVLKAISEGLSGFEQEAVTINKQLIIDSFNDFKPGFQTKLAEIIDGNVSPELESQLNAQVLAAEAVTGLSSVFEQLIGENKIGSEDTRTSLYSLSQGNISLVFNLHQKIENLLGGTLKIDLKGDEEVLINVNNKGLLRIDSSSINDGFVSVNVPVNYLSPGDNHINLSSSSVQVGVLGSGNSFNSKRYSRGNWLSLGTSDFNALLELREKSENQVLASKFNGVILPELSEQIYSERDISAQLTISDSFVSQLGSDVENELSNGYGSFLNDFLSTTVFDENCNRVIDIRAELRSFKNTLIANLNSFFTSEVSGEITENDIRNALDDAFDTSGYDFNELKRVLDETTREELEPEIEGESRGIAVESWPFIRDSLINEINNDNATPIIKSLRELIIEEYDSLINEELKVNLDIDVFKDAFTSDDVDLDGINRGIGEVSENVHSMVTPMAETVLNKWLYTGYDDFRIDSLINDINTDLRINSESVISKSELSAWEGNDVGRMDCWRGPNGGWFEGFTTINDLIAYNRYTSVSRLTPELMFLGSGSFLYKLPSAGFYMMTGENSAKKLSRDLVGLTVEGFFNLCCRDSTMALLQSLSVMPATGNVVGTKITGMGVGRVIFLFAKEAAKVAFKDYLLNEVIPQTLENAGINLPEGSVFMHGRSSWDEEIVYADGSTRTFDPYKIVPISCYTMEELGCRQREAVWVDEDASCYTEIFVRNIGDIGTWLKLILQSDECLNAYNRGGCEAISGGDVCYRDTLTACYRMTCESNFNERRVFQYWIGSSGDPASFGPPMTSRIPQLEVFRDDDKIVLHVPTSKGGVPLID